jgi:hypothetical protein
MSVKPLHIYVLFAMDELLCYYAAMSTPEFRKAPIEPRPLAAASARREYADTQVAAERESRLSGEVYVPHKREIKEQAIKQIAVRNEQILQARGNKPVANELNLLRLADQLLVFNDFSAEELMISEKNKPIFEKHVNRRNVELFYEPTIDTSTSYLFKEFDEAESLAEERGLSISQVYEDDNLYAEVIRKTYETPQKHAEVILAPAMNKDLHEASRLYHRAYEGFRIHIFCIEQGDSKQDAQAKAEYYVDKLESIPEHMENVESFVHDFRQVHYVAADEEVRKYWGEEGIDSLSPAIKGGIAYYKGD